MRAYDKQVASIPSVVEEVLRNTNIPELDSSKPLIFTGIGTSLHAARVAADWVCLLSGGARRAFAVDAHDLGTGTWPTRQGDQVVVISHRGKKLFPTAAQVRARKSGASIVVAVVGKAAPEQTADVTIHTCDNETAGTFSVSYLASLAVLAKIAASFVPESSQSFLDSLPTLPQALAETLAVRLDDELVGKLSSLQPLLITGFGQDFVTAQEAALKIKEGAWQWAEGMSPEFALHGTPAVYHPGMGAVVMLPEASDAGRSQALIEVLRGLNLGCVATCGVGRTDLPFALPQHPLLRPFLSILPFHQLTAELARIRQTDPDSLHGDREPWKRIMSGLQL